MKTGHPATIEFIQSTARRLGVEDEIVALATTRLLNHMRNTVDKSDLEELLECIPGARDLLNLIPRSHGSRDPAGREPPDHNAHSRPKNLVGLLIDMGFEEFGAALFISLFVYFLAGHLSSELMGRILNQAPELKSFTN